MKLHIMPIKGFLQANPDRSHAAAVLSTSASVQRDKIPCPYVLAEYMDFDYESPRSFSGKQAAAFAAFVKQLDESITDLYVCCDAGQSRSPAIAAAILRYFSQSDRPIWENPQYHPNVLCFCYMLDAFDLPISDEEVDALIHANRSAFKNAIRQPRAGN